MLKSIHYISSHTQWSSKHVFEVVDKTDEVSSKYCFEVVDRTDEVSNYIRTDEVSNHIYGNVTLTWSEEIFEEYYISKGRSKFTPTC
ncbi:chlorohydrolase [Streptococcus pneumoniae]|nr:chlorohydrolase [Streptococcus pneumoniae]